MTAPVVEIVVPADASTDAMVSATAEGLAPTARVQLVERPSDSADVVVRVRWSDDARRRATLTVRTSDGRETERTLAFESGDPAAERGRAIGYAVAAMIPADVRGIDSEPAPPSPPPSPPPSTPPPIVAPAAREEPVHPAPPRDHARERLWIEGSAQASTGIGGSAGGLGGSVALRVPFSLLALRIGGAVRAGEVSDADASSMLWRGDAGVGFFTVIVDPHVRVGARTGLVFLHHVLSRTEPGGGTSTGSHTLLGAEAMAEGSVLLGGRFSLILAAGAETAFGSTRVLVGPARVASIPAVRAVGELGARFAF